MRGRDAAVSAVSEPEKKAERIIKTTMARTVRIIALSIVALAQCGQKGSEGRTAFRAGPDQGKMVEEASG